MQSQPATTNEVIENYAGKRVRFEHWVRETYFPRSRAGVRHRTKTTATCRVVDGKPVVRYLGDDYELKAEKFQTDSGYEFIACATIM